MRTFLALILALAFPAQALAAFSSSHEALGATRHTGVPREFGAQAHNSTGGTFVSQWINGVQEGKGEWLKLRMDVTTHMKQHGDFISLNMRVLVYRNTLYYTIRDATLLAEDDLTKTQLQSMLKKWVAMPLPASVDVMSAWNFVDILDAIDMDMLSIAPVWNDVRTSMGSFSMEHTRYQGGDAYSIMSIPGMNLHIKLNTTRDGTLEYGKYYVSRGNFVFQGSMQPHASTVNLDVPNSTISPHEFEMHLLGFEFPMMYGDIPLPVTPSVPEQSYTPPPAKQNILSYTSEPAIPETRNYVEYAKRSGNAQEAPVTCAWPGTLDAVELERKAVCPTRRVYKREINQMEKTSLNAIELRENRIAEQRLVDTYDRIAMKFEGYAHRRDLHRAKSLLSRISITSVGSDEVDNWILSDVIPFFMPVIRTSVVEYIILEDGAGREGIALQKMATTETGRRKDVVILLFKEREDTVPVVTDVYLNAKLRDLQYQGIIE